MGGRCQTIRDKKAPNFGALWTSLDIVRCRIGGGGGNWTRVRQSSAEGSTCLVQSIKFSGLQPDRQGAQTAIPVSF